MYKNKGTIQMKPHNPFFLSIQKIDLLLVGETRNHLFTDTIKMIH